MWPQPKQYVHNNIHAASKTLFFFFFLSLIVSFHSLVARYGPGPTMRCSMGPHATAATSARKALF